MTERGPAQLREVRETARPVSLLGSCSNVIIVAHTEDVAELRSALEREGFCVGEVRGPYSEEQEGYSRNIRCLINHANAWRIAESQGKPTIVVEADFVPVVGFGTLPLPFVVSTDRPGRFAWLYSAGSILYGFDVDGRPHGHGNTTVAYALDGAAAGCLLEFFEREMSAPDPGRYRPWETYLGIFLRREKGILNHLSVYQYGEHGGESNAEHAVSGARAWHEADILAGRLAFLPRYARGSRAVFRLRRLRGWSRGWFRLLALRFFDPSTVNRDSSRGRLSMGLFSVARLLRCRSVSSRLGE